MKIVLQLIYYLLSFIFYIPNQIWEYMFHLNFDIRDKIVVIGAVGGSGKSTLGRRIMMDYGHAHIKIDDCKFGEFWKRHSEETFKKILYDQIDNADLYILDTTHSDPRLSAQKDQVEKIIDESDLIVWNNIPKIISVWRKGFRSVKRAIGVVEPGSAPETFKGVRRMLTKTWGNYNDCQQSLEAMWKDKTKTTSGTFLKADWPYFY